MPSKIEESPGIVKRIVSLDAFRGFIMFTLMLHTFGLEQFKDHPVMGFFYKQLCHADWVGFHYEDFILPSFLFIIGVSMGLSDIKRSQKGESFGIRFGHAVKRAVSLFAIGFVISWLGNGKPNWGPGVLQLLAISYFFGYLAVNFTIRTQAFIAAGLLFVFWLLVFTIPVYDVGRNSYIVFKNLGYLIDNTITGSTSRWGYLFTVLTTSTCVIYGSIIGKLIALRKSDIDFVKKLLIFGIIGVIAGLVLHPFIPIIKRMFTPSYTIFTCGLASLLLGLFFWLIDMKNISKWSFPFVVIGMNSIFIYGFTGFIKKLGDRQCDDSDKTVVVLYWNMGIPTEPRNRTFSYLARSLLAV